MRKLSLLTLLVLALAAIEPAIAQDDTPATHRGTGTEIANNYRFFHEDRARMQNGQAERMMEAARQNMDVCTKLRAREGRPVTPRR